MSKAIQTHRFTSPTVREISEKRAAPAALPERQKEPARQRLPAVASLLATRPRD